jgi:hypothetical protein
MLASGVIHIPTAFHNNDGTSGLDCNLMIVASRLAPV